MRATKGSACSTQLLLLLRDTRDPRAMERTAKINENSKDKDGTRDTD